MSEKPTVQMLQLLARTDRELMLIAGTVTHQHYKGGLYRLLGVPRDADTGERAMTWDTEEEIVVYEHLHPHDRQLWVRTHEEFLSSVECPEWHPAAGSLERVRRFRPLGQGWAP